jgi:hypothetical protein
MDLHQDKIVLNEKEMDLKQTKIVLLPKTM